MTSAVLAIWVLATIRQVQCSLDIYAGQAHVFGQIGVLDENQKLKSFHFRATTQVNNSINQQLIQSNELQNLKAYKLCNSLREQKGDTAELLVNSDTGELLEARSPVMTREH